MYLGVGLPVEEMVDYIEDPWQGINIFLTPKITGIPSPTTVHYNLKKLQAVNDARVSDSSPFIEEGFLRNYAIKTINPSLGGASYTLFSVGPTLRGSDAVIAQSVSFQAAPHQSSLHLNDDLHRGLDSFLEQLAPTGEEGHNVEPLKGLLKRPL